MTVSGLHKKRITMLLVNSDKLIRAGLVRLILECAEKADVIESESIEDAIELARQQRPDIVLMSSHLSGVTGVEAARALKAVDESIRIILLIRSKSQTSLRQFMKLGVLGFITKNSSLDELRESIATVLDDEIYIASAIATKMAFAVINNDTGSPFDELSPRELEIIMMMLEGKKNQEIAESLYISDKTVSTYRGRALNKLSVGNTTELTLLAMRYDLIDRDK